jgi:hypothetical protein
MEGVVACAAYSGGRRVREIALEDISEVLEQAAVCGDLYVRFRRSGWL